MEFLKRDTRIDFIGRRRIAAVISIVIIVIGFSSLFFRGLNLGIDFTGGTLVEVSYSNSVSAEEVRKNLRRSGIDNVTVQYFGTSRDMLIKLPANPEADAAETSSLIMSSLRMPYGETLAQSSENASQRCVFQNGKTGECTVQMRRVEFVGPQVGSELTEKGGLAMLYALIGILAYVAWRFEWRFALGAVIALVHDVVVTVGLFSLLGLEFTLPVLAAVLAVIGYSLNDTIVVSNHQRQIETPTPFFSESQTYQAAAIGGHKINVISRDTPRRYNEIAFIFTILIIDKDDHFPVFIVLKDFLDRTH